MPRVFISHSSRDNAEAEKLKVWLRANEFQNFFLDIDKHAGIPPGVEWEKELYSQVSRSTVVLLLLTKNWHESKWCFVEFAQGRALGKYIIPVLVTADGQQFIGDNLQQINLTENRDEALQRLLHRLHEIGRLGPEGFSLPQGRPPYPGLLSFDRDDAAIYFGRSELVGQNLGTLEQLRSRGGERLLLLHGESGSGKSSLLKAGLLPQLERRKADWICLPTFRPGPSPTSELRAALLTALGSDKRSVIDALLNDPTVDHARSVADALHDRQGNHQATVLVVMDQFEELLTLPEESERNRFVRVLESLLDTSLRTLAIASVRTSELSQIHEILSVSIQDQLIGPFPLRQLSEIIKRPAQVVGLAVDDRLIAAIVRDAATPDMLPLVAFLLRQLYDRHGSDHRLTLEEYQSLGDARAGLSPLEACVRTAADHAIARVKPTEAELQALREAFVPGLVQVDDRGQFARQPLAAERIPAGATRLVEALITDRLLVRRGETVDVAHEALFKVWPFLRDLLAEEFEFLQGMTQLKASINDYLQLPPESRDQALLTGLRLSRNETWLARHPDRFDEQQRKYISESITARDQSLARRRRLQRNILTASVASAILFAILGGFAWVQRNVAVDSTAQAVEAQRQTEAALIETETQRDRAERQGYLAAVVAAAAKIDSNEVGAARDLLNRTADNQRGWEWNYLRAISDKSLAVLRGHEGAVNSVAISPDGTRIVTASDDKTARVWDTRDGSEVAVLGHEQGVNSAAFSPDGTRIVTTASIRDSFGSRYTMVWDAFDGLEVAMLGPHDNFFPVTSAAFSPDGTLIVTTSYDKTARVWDARDGSEVAVLRGHEGAVHHATFSPDGTRIVTASSDETARVWDAKDGSEIAVLHGHKGQVNFVAFSPNGTRMVTAGIDFSAWLWDAQNGTEVAVLHGHESIINYATFSPDGMLIVTASNDATSRIWDAQSGSEVSVLQGHEALVSSATFSPDGKYIVTASNDGTARVWEVKDGSEVNLLRGHVDRVAAAVISPDGTRIITASDDKTTRVWDALDASRVVVLNGQGRHVNSAKFSPDGTRIVTANGWIFSDDDNTARVWDARDGAELAVLRGHQATVNFAAFSPNGTRIVTASNDTSARVWDARNGTEVIVLRGHHSKVNCASFSPDGTRIVTASGGYPTGNDHTARVWDARSGSTVAILRGHEDSVTYVAFSLDGTRIVTTSNDKSARVWDANNGSEVAVLRGHLDNVTSAAFSPDGTRIVTSSDDTTVRVWYVEDGKQIAVLRAHVDKVTLAAFSPDGTRIVTAGLDRTARVWDAQSASEVAVLRGHKSVVATAAFTSDGIRLVTAGWGGTAQVWDSISAAERYKATGMPLVPRIQQNVQPKKEP